MRAAGMRRLAVVLWLCSWALPAAAWDTRVIGGLGDSDWHSLYESMPELRGGVVALHGNEHAEISAHALNAIGAGKLLDYSDVPVVVDLNASYFRRDLLYGSRRVQPADAPADALERRILPPPAQFSGLPDFSYSLYDWINKNQLCPLPVGAPERDKCHNYSGWIGAALNASHFGTQAALNYERLHKIALSLADRARGLRVKLQQTPGALQAYRAHLVEAEWMALAYEGVAQHFLADRWSTGHMWERWNAGDYEHLASRDLMVNKLVGYISGMFHGMQTVLHAKPLASFESVPMLGRLANHRVAHHLWPDPLSSPMVEIERRDGVVERLWNYYVRGESGRITLKSVEPAVFRHAGGGPGKRGIGDYGFRDLLDGNFGGREYGFENELPLPLPAQRSEMMACVQGGWADVIRALGKNPKGSYGVLHIPLIEDAPSLAALGERCFDVYVTNRSMMLAWPFSRPTFWSQLGRATLTVLSSDAGVAALGYLGKSSPLPAAAVKELKKISKAQLAAGRQAARNMVRLSYLAWRHGRKNPGGTDLARGGLGALDFTTEEVRKNPEAFIGGKNVIEPGDRYKAAFYFPRGELSGLPERDDPAGRDKAAVYGFFSRATADYWGGRLAELLPGLRGMKTRWRRKVCEYLADFAYNGTEPAYRGRRAEVRTANGRRDGSVVPSYLTALGVRLDAARVPVHLPPGYVAEPYARTTNGGTYRSVSAWCARVPVFHLLEAPEMRDRDVVAVVKGFGASVELRGADLGAEAGKLWIGCAPGEERRALEVQSWSETVIRGRLPKDAEPGRHTLCLSRADGTASVGRFVVEYRAGLPQVTAVEIRGAGETWYRQPGNVDQPLPGGSYTLEIEFDQAMDPEWDAAVTVNGPGGVRLSGGQWIDERHWRMRLDVPEEADAYVAAHGEHPLEISARSLGGRTLDADPATPGDQPERRYRFRVGGAGVPARLAGCYRPDGDDSAALEIGEDGHALALFQDGRKRIALIGTALQDGRLRLRHRFTPRTFTEYYRAYDGLDAGYVSREPASEEDKARALVPCRFRLKGPYMVCFDPLSKETRTLPVDVRRSYAEWVLAMETDDPAQDRGGRRLRAASVEDRLRARDGSMYSISSSSWNTGLALERAGAAMSRGVAATLQGTDRTGATTQLITDLFAVPLDDRPARIRRLAAVGGDAAPLSSPLADGTTFRLRAEGVSHCPGIRETVPVQVQLPGSKAPARVMLRETGPDTGLYEGPETPLKAELPPSMARAHLSVTADAELRSRLGLSGIAFNGDPAYRKAARDVTLSLEVRRGGVPPQARASSSKGYSYQGPPYRARQRMGRQVATVYAMPGRTRMEMDPPRGATGGPGRMILITREDLGVRWTLFPATRSYTEQPHLPSRMTLVPEGEETKGGQRLHRYRFTLQSASGPVQGTLWKDARGVTVRVVQRLKIPGAGEMKQEIVLEDVRVGPLDEALFELPPDYRPAGGYRP